MSSIFATGTTESDVCICHQSGNSSWQLRHGCRHLWVPLVGLVIGLIVGFYTHIYFYGLIAVVLIDGPILLLAVGRMLFRHAALCALRWACFKMLEFAGEGVIRVLISGF